MEVRQSCRGCGGGIPTKMEVNYNKSTGSLGFVIWEARVNSIADGASSIGGWGLGRVVGGVEVGFLLKWK